MLERFEKNVTLYNVERFADAIQVEAAVLLMDIKPRRAKRQVAKLPCDERASLSRTSELVRDTLPVTCADSCREGLFCRDVQPPGILLGLSNEISFSPAFSLMADEDPNSALASASAGLISSFLLTWPT